MKTTTIFFLEPGLEPEQGLQEPFAHQPEPEPELLPGLFVQPQVGVAEPPPFSCIPRQKKRPRTTLQQAPRKLFSAY
jgi:hypothetical protein